MVIRVPAYSGSPGKEAIKQVFFFSSSNLLRGRCIGV